MQSLYILQNDSFADKVIDTIEKFSKSSKGIVGIDSVPGDVKISSPSFIDNIEENLPENLPDTSDIILAIGIGSYLHTLPDIAERLEAEGAIVPIEKSDWYQMGTLNQVKRRMERNGVDIAFPRPFCALEEKGRKSIQKFVKEFGIGRPKLDINEEEGKINDVEVEITAPCGSTLPVAEKIVGTPVSFESSDILELEDRVSKAWHSYPCTGDMVKDPILEETILHRAGYLVRRAVKKAADLDLEPNNEEKKSGTLSKMCQDICGKCIETCEKSETGILEIDRDEIIIPDFHECTGCRHCVKACPTEVMSKLITKRDNILLEEWEEKKLSN